MTNEELEQKVKQLEEQLTEVRIELLERKAEAIPYKPYEVEVPEDIEDYVYINNFGNIYNLNTLTIVEIEKIYKRGLAFKTREEAEQFDKERILIFKMNKWAEEHNEGWIPNWKDFDEEKSTIIYDNNHEELEIYETYFYRDFTKLPVLKSEKIVEQFIEEFGDEIKEVLL